MSRFPDLILRVLVWWVDWRIRRMVARIARAQQKADGARTVDVMDDLDEYWRRKHRGEL